MTWQPERLGAFPSESMARAWTLALLCAAACASPDASAPAIPDVQTGWEGFFGPSTLEAQRLAELGVPLTLDVVRAPQTRVAKLVIANGPREAADDELRAMQERDCTSTLDRAWNAKRCAALEARTCEDGTCAYEHFGNCSGLQAGDGQFITAAHCVEGLVDDPARAQASEILVAADDGTVARHVSLGPIVTGKTDFAHHWVALDDDDPLDVASIEIDDGGLASYPTAPLPDEGDPVFIVGYPRVEGRAPDAIQAAGYRAIHGTPSVSFGRLADRNTEDAPLCNPDGNQEHWTLRAPCPVGEVGETWRGPILHSPFLATYDSINGYSGGPVFDARGHWIGINATLISKTNPQERYDPSARMVATPVDRALRKLRSTKETPPADHSTGGR